MGNFFDSQEEAINFIVNLNRNLFLNRKDHIKKYYRARKIHSSVLEIMVNYIDSGKLPIDEYFDRIVFDVRRETKGLEIFLDNQELNDAVIFNELFMYKTHNKFPSLTEIYIQKKKFKSQEKVKMFYAMNDSIVGLFKVIGYDNVNGYVTYQDVFTKKKYKIIDISMSSLGKLNEGRELYIYNRIIVYDGIWFGTGLPCIFNGNNKWLKDFIKHHKYTSSSNFSRCLMLYDIARNGEKINAVNYSDY